MEELHNFFILQNLSEEEIKKIEDYSYKKEFKKDEMIYREGEKGHEIYLILSGLFKIFTTSRKGRDKTLEILGEGDFFGEMALFDEAKRLTSVQAVTVGVLRIISRDKYKKLISEFPEIALKTIGALSLRLQEANQEIKNLTFQTTDSRLKQTLKHLGNKFGEKKDKTIQIKQKFTHQELADMVGTTRANVTKLLNNMQEEDLIDIKDRTIYLKDSFWAE